MQTADVLRLAQPRARQFAPGLLFGILSAGSAVALLATSGYLIARAAEQPPILYLSIAIVGVRGFALARATFRYLDRLAGHNAAFRALATLRVSIYERLVPLAPGGLASTRRGDLLSRLVRDVDDLQNLPLRVVQPLATALLVAALAVVGVWLLLPSAAVALAVCLLLALVAGTAADTLIAARAEHELAPLRGDFADQTLDVIGRLDVLTAFGATDARLARLGEADARLTRSATRRAAGAGATAAVVSLLAGLATVAALVLGIPALSTEVPMAGGANTVLGGLTGPVLAVLALVPIAVFEVFGAVPLAAGAWRHVHSSAARVASAVPDAIPPEVPQGGSRGGTAAPPRNRERSAGQRVEEQEVEEQWARPRRPPVVELRHVWARWPGAAQNGDALRDVSVSIRSGERLLVQGASGSGKTTFAHVLVRFLDHTGSLTIDGTDVRTLRPEHVRSLIGLCEQQPHIFDANLRQNLLFARETAADDELLAVLGRVGLAEWAAERGGLAAPLGERGALISGGEAQRIALARVLLAGFPVVVFDEPTANVDATRADTLLRDLLAATGPDRSVVLISHTEVPLDLVTQRLRLG